eukprot:TRINITY_DN2488_c0_g1_i2.p1 TRINITY_DN2488_c0_g1~~TRINITY_DN2488_c0_g1_i2.p1  ORF type:complete len:554 (+),score=118.94 TRINITY_DN2488_c0_g1_i2:157-1818(+)
MPNLFRLKALGASAAATAPLAESSRGGTTVGNLTGKGLVSLSGQLCSQRVSPVPDAISEKSVAELSSKNRSQFEQRTTQQLLLHLRAAEQEKVHPVLERLLSNGSSSGSEHESISIPLDDLVQEFMGDAHEPPQKYKLMHAMYRAPTHQDRLVSELNEAGSDAEDIEGMLINSINKVNRLFTASRSPLENLVVDEVQMCIRSLREECHVTNGQGKQAASNDSPVPSSSLPDCTTQCCSGDCFRRRLISKLRSLGHNAAVCKTKWDHSKGFPGGSYEYVDIIGFGRFENLLQLHQLKNGNASFSKMAKLQQDMWQQRMIVDVDFRSQFQIARPTEAYAAALQLLPDIFVGSREWLQKIVEIMAEGVKQSLKARSMHLPPWRKIDYMYAKWFGTYKRTVNEVPRALQHHVHSHRELVEDRVHGVRNLDDQSEAAVAPLLEAVAGEVDAFIFQGQVLPAASITRRQEKHRIAVTTTVGAAEQFPVHKISPSRQSHVKKVAGLAAVLKEQAVLSSLKQATAAAMSSAKAGAPSAERAEYLQVPALDGHQVPPHLQQM